MYIRSVSLAVTDIIFSYIVDTKTVCDLYNLYV